MPEMPERDERRTTETERIGPRRDLAPAPSPRFVGAAYPSFYVDDLDGAAAFWTAILGPPGWTEGEGKGRVVGFRVGATWLTLFAARGGPHPDSGAKGCEFALRVAEPGDVDQAFAALVAGGATSRAAPCDTWMYERMRFACADTPHGIRVDVYCPLEGPADRTDPGAGPGPG